MFNAQYILSNSSDILNKKRGLRKELVAQANLIEMKIAILSGSTIGEIKNILELFLLSYGIKPVFWVGDFNRYYEEAVFDNESLKNFKPDIIYVHTTNKNISNYPSPSDSLEDRNKKLYTEYNKFEQIWTCLRKKYNCSIIQNSFEPLAYRTMGNADCYMQNGKLRFINELNQKQSNYANCTTNFYINDINYIASYYGIEKWANMTEWYLYKYALDINAIPLLCHNIANIIKSIFGKNKKAMIMDLDNTLWGGVIGDDGVENIELGEESPAGRAFSDFQQYIKELSELGILLNVCSKNQKENAEMGFTHEASILKKEDFISYKVNWNNKHENIEEIAKEINLMMDSLVFIDDNPAERDMVKSHISQIEIPSLTVPEEYIKNIDQLGYFEITSLSQDDFKRKEFYTSNKEREHQKLNYKDYGEYLKSLQMTSMLGPFDYNNVERITQLINKTNQFNFTTIRYEQSDIEEIIDSKKYITIKADLKDKFGSNGTVTALIASIENNTATIELWVMSCRVFKRDLEFAVFDELVLQCIEKKISRIVGVYKLSSKNAMIKGLYGQLGFEKQKENTNETIWEYKVPAKYVEKNRAIGVNKNE